MIPYLEPIWPAIAVLVALGIERARAKGARFGADLTVNAVLAGALLCAGAGYALGAGYAARFGITPAAAVVLAALAGAFLLALLPLRVPLAARVAIPFLVFFAAALAAFPRVARAVTPWPLVSAIAPALGPDAALVQRGHYLEAAPWYARRLTPVSGLGWSELDFGRAQASATERAHLFPSDEAFRALWNSPAKVLAIVHRDRISEWGRGTLRPFRLVAADGARKHYLLVNF